MDPWTPAIDGTSSIFLRRLSLLIEKKAKARGLDNMKAESEDLRQKIKLKADRVGYDLWIEYDERYILIVKLHHILERYYQETGSLHSIHDYVRFFNEIKCGHFFPQWKIMSNLEFIAEMFIECFEEIGMIEYSYDDNIIVNNISFKME